MITPGDGNFFKDMVYNFTLLFSPITAILSILSIPTPRIRVSAWCKSVGSYCPSNAQNITAVILNDCSFEGGLQRKLLLIMPHYAD